VVKLNVQLNMQRASLCPCCGALVDNYQCETCGHSWHSEKMNHTHIDYAGLSGRNALPERYVARKLDERLAQLESHLKPGMRILEVGCAEGLLGARIKARTSLMYWGIEPSRDSELARTHLDAVFRDSSELPSDIAPFDAILSFHVLEHISEPELEIARWRAHCHETTWLLIEVPCRGGHADVAIDCNPEHLHHFSPASLASLLEKNGFDPLAITRGHYESPVYTDSLRIFAIPKLAASHQRERLAERFSCIPAPFAVFGLGGDFRNYVQPLIDRLPVTTLLDSNPALSGSIQGRFRVECYQPSHHAHLPILVSSLRHERSIMADLHAAGHAKELIYLLADIYDKT